MIRTMTRGAAAVLAAGLALSPALAANPAYQGTWLITEAQIAPWVKPGEPVALDDAEMRHLIGSRVVYRKARIEGPSPLGCAGPRYKLRKVQADYLFQGTLTDPEAQARGLGFRSRPIMTLETGCEGLIDYHFTGPTTALFALNNRIYTLRKQ